eukprot:gnl/MRDRNA2_/MRDRNA2_134704_c0_seq1.p1 gnl/MRDRNA2_/MRDRNA2_134704_c0~~gnl/MRDRNA2_/MRDRNA2_134704_c0_seq1.p1  ORF type:complete len:136 (+),score=39.34 gnl/MRDRNA2_/MRDRNA2_134704_c0_seq1:67-474(+)
MIYRYALVLFALLGQAHADEKMPDPDAQSALKAKAYDLAHEIVALRYIKPGIESTKEQAVYDLIVKDHEKQMAALDDEVKNLGGTLNMRSLLKTVVAKSMKVSHLIQNNEEVKDELHSLHADGPREPDEDFIELE